MLLLGQATFVQADESMKKKTMAIRATQTIKIDGHLNESDWQKAPLLSGFTQVRPNPGKVEDEETRTEVRVLYDNEAIYVGAKMYDKPQDIAKELRARDKIGNADFFGIFFDTFLDGINANGFFVTAAGVQFDAKYSVVGGEDSNWNAVWESEVQMVSDGWIAELKIPYSALRFSNKESQNWGFNIIRNRTGKNEQRFWSFVDPKVSGLVNQFGVLENLESIKAPLRLAFSPYLSSSTNHYPSPLAKNWTNTLNGGMDVKFGIDKSFTLDMTLIPDFGQVRSDNRVLNLSPFEVRFNENRQFFTEGTELFNKGDLFYSKRIGSIPNYYQDLSLGAGERLENYPTESKIINASKISGRTASGLGIGLINAVTNRMYAEVVGPLGERRLVENQPFTNYNVLVLDQNLKHNSSLTFVNTNVWRQGTAYDANVTALMTNLNTKGNKYYLNLESKLSYLTQNPIVKERYGTAYRISLGKKSGNWTYSYTQNAADRRFNPSDLGYYTNNNFLDQGIDLTYNDYKPNQLYNRLQAWFVMEYSRRFRPSAYQSVGFYPGLYMQFKNFWSVELNGNYLPVQHDYYESRDGSLFKAPARFRIGLYVNPNHTKAYNFGGNIRYTRMSDQGGVIWNTYLFQNWRVNDKLALTLETGYSPSRGLLNWLTKANNGSIFSSYDRETVENLFYVKYSFNRKMGLTFIGRHYWSDRRNKAFYKLNSQGGLDLLEQDTYTSMNRNYNVFNIDMVYTWQFRAGSELSIAYKNAGELSEQDIRKGYSRNLREVLSEPQNQTFSVKLLYYIDYLQFKKNKQLDYRGNIKDKPRAKF